MTDRIHFFTAMLGGVCLCGGVCQKYGLAAGIMLVGVLLIATVIVARIWGN